MTELRIISLLKEIEKQSDFSKECDCYFHTFGKGPATEKEIKELEKFIRHPLPDEHKAILMIFGSCTLDGKEDSITFFPVNELIHDIDPIEKWDKEMGNTSIIGADNGGTLFFYDLVNQSGRGFNSIFCCYPGNMSWEDSLFLGTTLVDVLTDTINGTDFFQDKNKPYGKNVP